MPALEPRDAGPAGRLVVRRRWRSSVSRHPIPSAGRWRGNARDAIRGLVRSQPRGRRYGGARVCARHSPRERTARERGRVYGRARGPLCSKMRRDCRKGRQVSGGTFPDLEKNAKKISSSRNSTVHEPPRRAFFRRVSEVRARFLIDALIAIFFSTSKKRKKKSRTKTQGIFH